jgi:HlyD family secretion protein
MNRASLINSNRKYWLIAGLVLLVVAGLLIWLNQSRATASTTYQTSAATLGTLTANVGATGTIRTAHSAVLVWNTTGRVQNVNVSIGTKVRTDQVLAVLATDSVPNGVILAKANLLTAQLDLDNLLNSNNSVAVAMQNLADAKQSVKDAQDAYDYLTTQRYSSELVQNMSDDIDKAKAQLKMLEFIYRLFKYSHRPDGANDKDLMVIQLTNAKQNITNLTTRYNWFTSKPSPLTVEESLAALNVAKAKQADAQRDLDRVKNGNNIDNITAARAKVAAAQSTFDQARVISPFDGTITQAMPQAGDRVSSGQTAFRVDDLSQLMVDLEISEVDINTVAVGQPVTVSLDAIPNKIYKGVVSKVNQSAQVGQSGINFTVSVTITDSDELVKPGMTAAVTITTKEVANALLVPNRAVRMLDNQRVVYILKDKQPVPVKIRLGAAADANSQVVGGDLKAGDLIILNPPNAAGTQSISPTLTPTK